MRYLYPRFFLAILLLACLPTARAFSQWHNYLDGSVISVVVDGGSFIWAGSKEGGLMKIDKTTGDITYFNRANSELRSMRILSMIKDQSGKLWIGTEGGGLMTFDGNKTWEHFYTENSELHSNDINAIARDASGNIWLATDEGLARFDGVNHYGSWTTYTTDNSDLPNNKVSAVSVGADGSVWAGTFTKGLVKINGDSWTVYRKASSPLPSDSITTINANLDTRIWVGLGTGRAVEVKDGSTTWDVVDLKANETPGFLPSGRQIFEIRKGAGSEILFSTYTGLVRWDGTNKVRYPNSNSANEDNAVFSTLNDNGTLYAGTRRGIAIFKDNAWTTKATSATGMNGGTVSNVLVDKTGTVWLTSLGGLTRFDGSNWKVWGSGVFHFQAVKGITLDSTDPNTHWMAVIDGVHKITGENVQKVGAIAGLAARTNVIITDKQGNIWAGTESGLGKMAPGSGTWTTFTSSNSQIPDGAITALAVDKDNNIWVGTGFNGVAKYDGSAWTVYTPADHPELGSGAVRSIAFGPDGAVYFATIDMGVAKLMGSTFSNFSTFNSPMPSDNVTALAVDQYGAIWIGTGATGVAKYKNGQWNIYSTQNSGLTEDRVSSISIGRDQKIWIGTESSGLAMYDEALVLGVDRTSDASGAMMLSQNTPNPFSGATMLQFTLPARGDVRLSVLDARGTEVAVVASGAMEAGEHILPFDAAGLPSGVYFTRLVAGSHVESRPMVVAK